MKAKIIDYSEFDKLLDLCVDPRVDTFMLLCRTYGLRVSECLALTFGHFVGKYLHIDSLKGSQDADFLIMPEIAELVSNLKIHYEDEKGYKIDDDDTPLFISRKKRYRGRYGVLSRQSMLRKIKKLAKLLKLRGNVGTHSFRKLSLNSVWHKTKNVFRTKLFSRLKNLDNLQFYISSLDIGGDEDE